MFLGCIERHQANEMNLLHHNTLLLYYNDITKKSHDTLGIKHTFIQALNLKNEVWF